MATFYNPQIITSGLIVCLDAANTKCYPGSGTTMTDLTGRGNTGTLTNGPTFNSANGGSIVLDGTNDYINGTDISSTFTGNMTAEAWIKVNVASGDWVRIVGTGGNNSTNRTFGLWYHIDQKLLWQRYGGSGGGSDPAIFPNSPVLTVGSWHHVAATTSGSSHVLYLNGNQIGTATAAGSWAASTENITIGYSLFHSAGNANIGIVRLYNVGLTAQQILENYNATRSRYGI